MARILPPDLHQKLAHPRGLIQVLSGPRQVGKTTAARSLFPAATTHYASADLPTPPTADFITENWRQARAIPTAERTLVLDEVQKIPRWSEVVKKLWDEDTAAGFPLRVSLLGSSAILIEKGLSESLTGRFEIHYFPHWTFVECRQAFGITLTDYVRIGGYPKTYDFLDDPERLENYIQNGIIEPALGRDILSLHAIDKPALLRQLFWYVSRLPAQIVSYQKILGHLQGRGNAATLIHYAELLRQAFLVVPINKFSPKIHRIKKSMPKWLFPNPGLITAPVRTEGLKNFTFENLVGSHVLNITFGRHDWDLTYWREKTDEIDFILTHRHEPVLAIEVKSGRKRPSLPPATRRKAGLANTPFLVISQENIPDFLAQLAPETMLAWAGGIR